MRQDIFNSGHPFINHLVWYSGPQLPPTDTTEIEEPKKKQRRSCTNKKSVPEDLDGLDDRELQFIYFGDEDGDESFDDSDDSDFEI